MPRARDWLLVPLLALVGVIGTAWGARSAYRALRNRSPLTLTCAEFLAHPPAADWVRLEACRPAVSNVGVETRPARGPGGARFEQTSGVYIPLRPVTAAPTLERVRLLLYVDHGLLLRLGDRNPRAALVQAAEEILAAPIEGLVEGRLDRSERERTALRELGLHLADEFVIIDAGARPRPLWLAGGVLGGGLGALGLLARKWRRRRRPVELARARVIAE